MNTPAEIAKAAASGSMRLRGEPQVFVSVAYDFEYLAEDGKRVFMKESEILLLINKTNLLSGQNLTFTNNLYDF